MYLCANLLECLRGSLGCQKCRFDPTSHFRGLPFDAKFQGFQNLECLHDLHEGGVLCPLRVVPRQH